MEPFLNTYSNRRVNPLNIQPGDVSVIDIGHALALCNRFAGHTRKPISVAQHCTWVSWLCDNGTSYEIPMAALLHDAAEAYLGDVTKWLKATPNMAPYREAEDRALQAILRVFKCEKGIEHPSIEFADKLMVCWEAEQGIHGFFNHEMPAGYEPVGNPYRAILNSKWKFLDWQTAEDQWRARFSALLVRQWAGTDVH
jgi:uncharacterized protein